MAACETVPHAASFKLADPAWTGANDELQIVTVGEKMVMLNPYFRDGTRLRLGPERDADFSDQHILNDAEVIVLDVSSNGFAKVQSCEDFSVEGWVRQRNLIRQRLEGLGDKATSLPGRPALPPARKFQRSSTISSIEYSSNEEVERAKKESSAGVERLMALNGVKAGFMSEEEKHILKESLSAQAMTIRRQLAKQKQRTFDPHTKVVRVWDSITTLALIFTATITPFEVCVMPSITLESMVTDPLSWIKYLQMGRTHDFFCSCSLLAIQLTTCFVSRPPAESSTVSSFLISSCNASLHIKHHMIKGRRGCLIKERSSTDMQPPGCCSISSLPFPSTLL